MHFRTRLSLSLLVYFACKTCCSFHCPKGQAGRQSASNQMFGRTLSAAFALCVPSPPPPPLPPPIMLLPLPLHLHPLPHSVTCIISVSGTRPYIDILERCNGKLRISISWHKLPASPLLLPNPHYPLGCHALTLCALCSDLFRFASISFRFVLVCFAAVLSVFYLRVAAAAAASGKAFPLRLPLLFHFPFRSSQFATFASDRSCLCHVESSRGKVFISFVWRNASTRVARSFRCCKHLERCRRKTKGAGIGKGGQH